jgi:transcriptional regulator with XRE-family HTH domain
MTFAANKLIKSRREALGLTDVQVAEATGLSIHEYGDIEQHADEIFTVTELRQVRKLAARVGIDLFQLFDLSCAFCEQSQSFQQEYSLPRNELIRRQRTALGLTQDQLGDQIGFDVVAIQDMETSEDFLEGWSFELIRDLAKILKTPVQVLLGVKCPKCNR